MQTRTHGANTSTLGTTTAAGAWTKGSGAASTYYAGYAVFTGGVTSDTGPWMSGTARQCRSGMVLLTGNASGGGGGGGPVAVSSYWCGV